MGKFPQALILSSECSQIGWIYGGNKNYTNTTRVVTTHDNNHMHQHSVNSVNRCLSGKSVIKDSFIGKDGVRMRNENITEQREYTKYS